MGEGRRRDGRKVGSTKASERGRKGREVWGGRKDKRKTRGKLN